MTGLLLAVMASCQPLAARCPSAPPSAGASSSQVDTVSSFAAYFSSGQTESLSCFDLVFIDPDAQTTKSVQQIRQNGTIPIAYLNVGEAEGYRWFFERVEQDWILGNNPNWPDHYYVDARKEGWQRLILDTVIPAIKEKGYEGLFLDMVDTALPGLFPKTRPGMVELIRAIHQRHPDLRLIMNNGLFLTDEVGPLLSGLAVEDTFTRYNFGTQTYSRTPPEAKKQRLERLHALQEKYNLNIFSINYAPPRNKALRRYALNEAREHGFLPFVSTIELDMLLDGPSS